MKNIAIIFGGVSPEHEVSVITGIQVVENIDKTKYLPIPVFVDQEGNFFLLKNLRTRKEYKTTSKVQTTFFRHNNTVFVKSGLFQKIKVDAVYNCCHGGLGEAGGLAGYFETLGLPVTSTNVESSALCMNKGLSKILVEKENIPTIAGMSIRGGKIKEGVTKIAEEIESKLSLPVILKPVHYGSSIGIKIAKTKVELELALNEGTHLDTEILVEKFLSPIKEYNCSVRVANGKIETSPVEKPFSKDEILSFKDKYESGGGKKTGGMATLDREIPAKIPEETKNQIQNFAKTIYSTLSCSGVVRIDFIMDQEGNVYFNEINPIPGSMSFYLWEASGLTFKEQITDTVEETLNQEKKMVFKNQTDIIEKFTVADFDPNFDE